MPLYCITVLLPLPLPAERASPSLHIVLLFPCCASLVCNGSSKVKLTEMLISEALAHSALEIRILVHYTQLLAEQSSVTGNTTPQPGDLAWNWRPGPSRQSSSHISSCKTSWWEYAWMGLSLHRRWTGISKGKLRAFSSKSYLLLRNNN